MRTIPSNPIFDRRQPLSGTDYEETTYKWNGKLLTFVTDPRDSDNNAEYIRSAYWVEPQTHFVCEWLSGRGSLIDLGANLGAMSIPVAAMGSRVLAVEPFANNYVMLSLAAKQNELSHLVPVHAAVGERIGTGQLAGSGAWGYIVEGGGLEVPLFTVDTLCDVVGFRKPGAVKIDVEGSERRVLRGMARTLRDDRPVVIIESNTWSSRGRYTYHELLADLEAYHYSLYLIHGFVLAPRTSADMQEVCVADFVAAPKPLRGKFGPFTIRPLTPDERIELLERDVDGGEPYRWHLASVLREYEAELGPDPRVARIHERILAYDERLVHNAFERPWHE